MRLKAETELALDACRGVPLLFISVLSGTSLESFKYLKVETFCLQVPKFKIKLSTPQVEKAILSFHPANSRILKKLIRPSNKSS